MNETLVVQLKNKKKKEKKDKGAMQKRFTRFQTANLRKGCL